MKISHHLSDPNPNIYKTKRRCTWSSDPAENGLFCFYCSKIYIFLTFYQTYAPAVLFLHDHLVTGVTSLMDVFVKKDAVDDIKALVDFKKFETKKTDIDKKTSNIDVGFCLKKLKSC